MSIITLDFETYFSKEYSLSRMSTEAYINDPRFEVIGVSVKMDDLPAEWFSGSGPEIADYLAQYDIKHCALLCHNAYFDGAILAWRFGIVPAFYFDTMCMCKITDGTSESASLAAMSERHGTGIKGNDAKAAMGLWRLDFTVEGLRAYGMYCRNDVEITRSLFDKLAEGFPETEISLIDLTIRMFTQPTLEVDDLMLVQKLEELKETKSVVLSALMNKLQCASEEEVRKKLSSNKEFAKVLSELGITAPTKESPVTLKQTFAFAKTDPGFIELTEHDDPYVQQICAARLGVKSTMEESRIIKFIEVGARNKGRLPVPLKYCAAHTYRWGGWDGINLQNLPSRDRDKRTLKNSLRAPAGHVIVHGDSSQIEARILVWWAGQNEIVEMFRRGEDIYCYDATAAYGFTVTKDNPSERFVGKTMRLGLGYGTGAAKLQHTLETSQQGVKLSIQRCNELVSVWRRKNVCVTMMWSIGGYALNDMLGWPTNKPWYWMGDKEGAALITPIGIKLPNGTFLRYKNLRREVNKIYHTVRSAQQDIWGGVVVENVTQALARIIIGEQMVAIAQRYRPILTVHDSLAVIVPERERDEAIEYIKNCMVISPSWATGLPLACEIKSGKTYGEC